MTGILALLVTGFPVHALQEMSADQMAEVTAREGLNININLDAEIGSLEIEDSNDNGVFALNQINLGSFEDSNSDGVPDVWNQANLTAMTLDVDGVNRMQIGMPSGDFDLGIDGFDPGSGSEIMGINASNVNFNSSAIRVGPN